MSRLFNVSLDLIFDDEKSKDMSKDELCDMLWGCIGNLGHGLQMLNIDKASEVSRKSSAKKIEEICKKACNRR